MKGWVETRTAGDGSKRYDACWRVGATKKSKTFHKRKAADAFLVQTVQKVQSGAYVEITPTTFKDYAESWIEGLHNLKPSTRRTYRSMLTFRLIPAFGERDLTALTVEDVNAWLRSCEGICRVKTLQNYLVLLHKILEDAREGGYLVMNRLSRSRALRRPRAIREDDETEIEILTPTEVHHLLDAAAPEWAPLFFTAVCTGVRLGELLALQWGDLDEAGHRLHVRRSVWRGVFYVPKSKRSRRAIDIGDQLLGVLSAARRRRYGASVPAPHALLFPAPSGEPLSPDALRKRVWAPTLATAGLRHVRIHSLRHTYASMLIAQNENPKYISSQLGHASIRTTLDRYGHLFKDEKRTAAARLEQQLAAAMPSGTHPAEPARNARTQREHRG